MKSTKAYHDITNKPITSKTMEWISELAERFGDDRLVGAMEAIGESGDLRNFLRRVSDRLATEDARRRPRPAPLEVGREQLLRIVRGEEDRPEGAFIWETFDLSSDEYGEVLAWSGRRKGLALEGVPS